MRDINGNEAQHVPEQASFPALDAGTLAALRRQLDTSEMRPRFMEVSPDLWNDMVADPDIDTKELTKNCTVVVGGVPVDTANTIKDCFGG